MMIRAGRLVRIVRPGRGVSGDLAPRADGAAVGPGHGRGGDREGGLHQRGPGPRRDPQLQRRWVQLALSEVQGRPPAEVHAGPSLNPPAVRLAIICDNFSPHLSTATEGRVGAWAAANNVEIACTPSNASWLNRIEAQFTALRYFALDGTDHASHREQASMIRRYIIWRNNHAYDERLRQVVDRANVG